MPTEIRNFFFLKKNIAKSKIITGDPKNPLSIFNRTNTHEYERLKQYYQPIDQRHLKKK